MEDTSTEQELQHDEHNFGICELQYGQQILKVLDATNLNAVDKDALAGTLRAINSHLANAMGSLR